MKKIICLLLALCFVFSLFSCDFNNSDDVYTSGKFDDFLPNELSQNHTLVSADGFVNLPKKQNTVLIYLLENDCKEKLENIKNSGVKSENTNVLVYVGAKGELLISENGNFKTVATTDSVPNMGDASVLLDFLNYAYSAFPAEKFSLIFSGFGAGPIFGIGESDPLHLYEIKWAMNSSHFKDNKFGFIGFDSSLMASLETAYMLSPFSECLIASEDVQISGGWDFGFLEEYNNSSSVPVISQKILETYENKATSAYEEKANCVLSPSYTLSVTDLGKVAEVVKSASKLFLKMAGGEYEVIGKLRNETKRFGASEKCDMVDLSHMADNLSSVYKTQAQSLIDAIDDAVIKKVSNLPFTGGLSIYYPYDNKGLYNASANEFATAYLNCKGYQEFLSVIKDKEPLKTDVFTLTQYDKDHAYFTPLLQSTKPFVANAFVFTLETDLSSEMRFLQASLIESVQGYDTYLSDVVLYKTPFDDIGTSIDAKLIFTHNTNNDEVFVERIFSTDDIDLSQFSAIGFLSYQRKRQDPSLTFDEWEKLEDYSVYKVLYKHKIGVKKVPLTSLDGEFCVHEQADFNEIDTENPTEVLHSTPAGDLVFKVYDDYAKLVDFKENESAKKSPKAIEIPSVINGKNVTVIGEGAFSICHSISSVIVPNGVLRIEKGAFEHCQKLTKVVLPNSLVFIGEKAFFDSTISEVNLPESLENIGFCAFKNTLLESVVIPEKLAFLGEGAFSGCEDLEAFKVSEKNQFFCEIDGVLFSFDKKTLLCYPSDKSDSYTVPKGTEVIGKSAFFDTRDLETVVFPDTLKSIENTAFFNCALIETLVFPSSLESIGVMAFGKDYTVKLNYIAHTVIFGENFKVLGESAFSGYKVKAFGVSPKNETFTSYGGILYDKEKESVIVAPNVKD